MESPESLPDDWRRTACAVERHAQEVAEKLRLRREMTQVFDEPIRLLLQAKAAGLRYLDAPGGLADAGFLVGGDLDEARAAIDDILNRLTNL